VSPDRLRAVVSAVLTVGVTLSAGLIVAGFVGSFAVGWQGSLSGAAPITGPVGDFGSIAAGLAALRPQAIAQLGLLTLVATPIARVLTSLVGFVLEGDRLYVAITATVLAILVTSALLIR
jgi:uncharacterized membrane protein